MEIVDCFLTYGHPTPALWEWFTQQLNFTNDFPLRGLDDHYRRTGDDSGRAAAKEMLHRYISAVERMLKGLAVCSLA